MLVVIQSAIQEFRNDMRLLEFCFTQTKSAAHWALTFDMSGSRKQAKLAGGCPLDGGVRRHVPASYLCVEDIASQLAETSSAGKDFTFVRALSRALLKPGFLASRCARSISHPEVPPEL